MSPLETELLDALESLANDHEQIVQMECGTGAHCGCCAAGDDGVSVTCSYCHARAVIARVNAADEATGAMALPACEHCGYRGDDVAGCSDGEVNLCRACIAKAKGE